MEGPANLPAMIAAMPADKAAAAGCPTKDKPKNEDNGGSDTVPIQAGRPASEKQARPSTRRLLIMQSNVTLSKSDYDAVIFDLDGVITKTAEVHARAWKRLFDEYLKKHAKGDWKPFDDEDYRRYVDGKPRYEGVKSFLESRGIELPYGSPEDEPEKESVCGLGNRKNRYFNALIEQDGVEVYEPAVRLLRRLRSAGFKTAVVSSSKNCTAVLKAAGISDLFDHKTDGVDAQEMDLEGKPSPDIFLVAAERLQVKPERAVVLEDALSGVEAGRKGGFGLVIGVDRTGHGADLKEKGADVVLTDLSAIKVENVSSTPAKGAPSALERFEEIAGRIEGKGIAVFLDYDGTLTPIVENPDKAFLSDSMKHTLIDLAEKLPVAVISGRDRPDVQRLVDIGHIFYLGSHGFDIAGPDGMETGPEKGKDLLPALDKAEKEVKNRLEDVSGAWVERKKFSIAVHYRKVQDPDVSKVKQAVEETASRHPDLRQSGGKKIFELQPKMDWHKGKALMWLLGELELDKPDVVPFYLGDDVTDEDAFRALKDRGIGVVVMDPPRETEAHYRLKDTHEVEEFLKKLQASPK
jgi:trehalose-phosphatase